jgi:regulator of protease activity HflC (stomatin/prohibitin superfamily)
MSYEDLSGDTRVWIYQSSRELSDAEAAEIRQKADAFAEKWTAHGKAMRAAIEVLYNRFIVVFADERQAMASGCSIDSSVRFIKQLEGDYNIALLDRMNIAYKEGDKVQGVHLTRFREMLAQGLLDENTVVFNNLVSNKADFDKGWEVPLKESWHKQLIS